MCDRAPFKDHFSRQSEAYRRFRPGYPAELFDWLASVAPAPGLALDVASGSGQAGDRARRGFLKRVVATEPSAAQLAQAPAHPRVEYRPEAAESISVAPGSVDLLVAAQAAHWFDWPRFAGKPCACCGRAACWPSGPTATASSRPRSIGWWRISRGVVGPYWPRERRRVEEGYRDLVVPLRTLEAPAFEMRTRSDAAAMLGYLNTWSAVRRCRARSGRDPLGLLAAALGRLGRGPRRCAGRSSFGLIAAEPRLVAARNLSGAALPYTPRPPRLEIRHVPAHPHARRPLPRCRQRRLADDAANAARVPASIRPRWTRRSGPRTTCSGT